MNTQQFTIKTQEILQNAMEIASTKGHQSVENGHLLLSMLDTAGETIEFLLKKIGLSNIQNLRNATEAIVTRYPKVSGGEAYLSSQLHSTLQTSLEYSRKEGDKFLSAEFLLFGLLKSKDDVAKLLSDAGLSEKLLRNAIMELRKGRSADSNNAESLYDSLNRYAINLNERARNGKLDPVIGRDEEIRRVLQILSRRSKNNPILIGEPGVGKTAIAEGIAHRIISLDVPENLRSKQVFSLDLGALVAGAKYKGEFEERLKAVVKEVIDSEGEIILFIDEIHTLVGAGRSDGAMDAANILKPALARGDLRAIGATTLDEYQKYFEKDKALERRFQTVIVDEPDKNASISILRGIKSRYESHHQLKIKDEAVIASVELSQRYISDRFLPDKAIDLMDEAAAKLRLEMNSMPEELDVIERKLQQLEIEREAIKREGDNIRETELDKAISEMKDQRNQLKASWENERKIVLEIQQKKEQIERSTIEANEAERNGDYGKVAELRYGTIKNLESEIENLENTLQSMGSRMLREEVTAEDIAGVVARWTGIPISRMLESEREKLLHLEDELHKRVIGQNAAISVISDAVRRNRAGLSDAKRPIGSFIFAGSTGVGKTELARALAELLFNDENLMTRIDMSEYQEKHSVSRLVGAPPGYVGYDEGGQLTEAVRHKPYSVVLFDEIEKAHPDVFNILLQVLDDGRLTDNKGRTVNFKNTIIIMTSNLGSELISNNDAQNPSSHFAIEEKVKAVLRSRMRPEFLNRIDEILVFQQLQEDEILQIVRLQVEKVQQMLMEQGISIELEPEVYQHLAHRGYEPLYGARPVKRIIQKELLNNLSKFILSGNSSKNIKVANKNDEVFIHN